MGYKVNKIRVGTQQVRPYRFTPGSNTIAYYPLTSSTTTNDISGNNRNLTNNGIQFGNYAGVDCSYFSSSNSKRLYGTLPLTGNQKFTFSVWVYRLGNSPRSTSGSQIFALGSIGTAGANFGLSIINSNNTTTSIRDNYQVYTWGLDKPSGVNNTIGQWEQIIVTNDGSTVKIYKNGTIVYSTSLSFNVGNTNFTVGSFPSGAGGNTDYQGYYGYMSEMIVESIVRTDTESANYYNNTKSNYLL